MSETIDITLIEDQLEGTAATFSQWLVAVGDNVDAGAPIAEIETDKVALEIVAPQSGRMTELLASTGDAMSVGTTIARMDTAAEVDDEDEETLDSVLEEAISLDADDEDRISLDSDHRQLLSPSVRRMMRENDIHDLSGISGTGKSGRISSDDLKQWLESAPDEMTNTDSVDFTEVPSDDTTSTMKPHSSMRKSIASHMVESLLHTAPHVTSVFEMEMSAIIKHRKTHKQRFADQGVKLTFTSYFVMAASRALQAVPEVNARFHDDALELFHDINIGVGTALGERGLIVPVIHQVQDKDLLGVSSVLNEQTARARAGELNSQDVRHGTFTISNHGVSGSLFATPIIINQPQVAILGIGKMENRLKVVDRDGARKVRIQPMCYVTLTIDHRALDAHQTNRWLSVFVEAIENWPAD